MPTYATATGSEILSDKHDGIHGYSVELSRENLVLSGPVSGIVSAPALKSTAGTVNVNAPVNYSDSVLGMLYVKQGTMELTADQLTNSTFYPAWLLLLLGFSF